MNASLKTKVISNTDGMRPFIPIFAGLLTAFINLNYLYNSFTDPSSNPTSVSTGAMSKPPALTMRLPEPTPVPETLTQSFAGIANSWPTRELAPSTRVRLAWDSNPHGIN